jgi:hypothetical protein
MFRSYWLWCGCVAFAVAAGCSRTPAPDGKPGGDADKPSDAGRRPVIPPRETEADRVSDAVVTPAAEVGVVSGRVTEDAAGKRGAADTLIWLGGAPPKGERPAPGPDLELRQRDGVYSPRVQVAMRGSRLRLISADETANFKVSGAMNFSVSLPKGKQEVRGLGQFGLASFTSELHPDAAAYVWVLPHPYFAKTDDNGNFQLPPLPPGKYRIILWHEGKRETGAEEVPAIEKWAMVELTKDKGASIKFTLAPREAAGK